MVSSGVPLSCTATAFSEISYSLVTFAPGALARSHLLNSLRPAASWARYDVTALLLKSIFLPSAGLVAEYVLSGAPLSCTIAPEGSTPGPWLKASALMFRLVIAGPATPSAMMHNVIPEKIKHALRIFFIAFSRLRVLSLRIGDGRVNLYFP